MKATLRRARRAAGALYREINPTAERAAWQRLDAMAGSVRRYTPGRVQVLEYDLEYADLLTFCPQFEEIFVHRGLAFSTSNPVPRILDCGANIGAASLFFKREYPDARITAYEADPALAAMTKRNLDRNRAGDVEVVQAAVWTSPGTVSFRAEGADSGSIDSVSGALDAKRVVVPSLRLRDVLAADQVDMLKLDIEGAEADVLDDCAPVLDRVKAIVLDLHEFDPKIRQSPRVFECLTRCGFTYSCDALAAQPWRPPVAGDDTPFPKLPLVWTMTVRAWRA